MELATKMPTPYKMSSIKLAEMYSTERGVEAWPALIDQGRFDLVIAEKSLKLNRNWIAERQPTKITEIIEHKDKLITLGSARHYRGLEYAADHAAIVFASAMSLMKPARKVDDDEAWVEIAMWIVEDYVHLTYSDLKLMVKMGMKGKFGANYERIDVQTIFQWAEAYDKERLKTIQVMQERKYKQRRKDEEQTAVKCPPDLSKKISDLADKVEAKDPVEASKRMQTWQIENDIDPGMSDEQWEDHLKKSGTTR